MKKLLILLLLIPCAVFAQQNYRVIESNGPSGQARTNYLSVEQEKAGGLNSVFQGLVERAKLKKQTQSLAEDREYERQLARIRAGIPYSSFLTKGVSEGVIFEKQPPDNNKNTYLLFPTYETFMIITVNVSNGVMESVINANLVEEKDSFTIEGFTNYPIVVSTSIYTEPSTIYFVKEKKNLHMSFEPIIKLNEKITTYKPSKK